MPLTKKQSEVLDFIREHLEEHGYAPSYREIADHFGLSSLPRSMVTSKPCWRKASSELEKKARRVRSNWSRKPLPGHRSYFHC